MYLSNKDRCSTYGKRATKSRRENLYCIEDEYVTMTQIAERIGTGRENASDRMSYLKKQPGRITWAGLKGVSGYLTGKKTRVAK
jgi:hypothetical protein